jgi:hypothetical protein
MEQQIAQQQRGYGGGSSGGRGGMGVGGSSSLSPDDAAPGTVFSSDVSPYVTCTTGTPSAPVHTTAGRSYSYVTPSGQFSTCTFNQQACQAAELKTNSYQYLQSVGLPPTPSSAASSIGGSTLAPTDSNWNHSKSMQACSFASKPVDNTIATINDNVTRLISFGQASTQPQELRANHEYQGCGKWYFPDSAGDFAGTPHDQQPFVAAWKYSMVMPGGGT